MSDFFGIQFAVEYPPYGHNRHEYYSKHKNPKAAFEELKNLINSTPALSSYIITDKTIERFLFARKHIPEDALELIRNYYEFRKRNPEIFRRLNAHEVLIHQALLDGFPCVLKNRDRKGRRVLLFSAFRWNCKLYPLMTIYRALLLSLEYLILDEVNMRQGFVVIIDWSEFSFKQSFSLNVRLIKTMIDGLQDSFPARFKGIHFIGQPWYVETTLTVIKPFLKEKSKSKIKLHGNNLSTLHQYITTEVLPPELGGEGPEIDTKQWLQTLLDAPLDNFPILPDDELTPYAPETIA